MKITWKKSFLLGALLIAIFALSACSSADLDALSEAQEQVMALESQISSQVDGLNDIQIENEDLNAMVQTLEEKIKALQTQDSAAVNTVPASSLLQASFDVLTALESQDMTTLASLVLPNTDLLFSPYVYVDTQSAMTFSSANLQSALSDTTVYTWGAYDGSGDPMTLTFSDYYADFVYDHDYLNPHIVGVNQWVGSGNTINNIDTVFPNAESVEYHFTGFDAQYEGMDWSSLILVFEQQNGSWYLVAIVHNGWTI